ITDDILFPGIHLHTDVDPGWLNTCDTVHRHFNVKRPDHYQYHHDVPTVPTEKLGLPTDMP
ncbi:hypothetical protein LTS18_006764, partial [Coniosporium uncinatum]